MGGRSLCRWRSSSNATWRPGSCGFASITANGRCSAITSSAATPHATRTCVVGHRRRVSGGASAGDTDRITATFEADGCFREPAGGEFRVCGTDVLLVLRSFLQRRWRHRALEHCTVTEDGTRTALEFNAVKWGSTDMPPQAGGRSTGEARPADSARRASTTTSIRPCHDEGAHPRVRRPAVRASSQVNR